MVEIIRRKKKERALEDKAENLLSLASKVIGKDKLISGIMGNYYFFAKETIGVYCSKNTIKIDKEEDFDTAFKLAQAYEKETNESWFVKTNYN